MDYEKKYKEALEDMRAIYPNLKGDAKLAVEHAFPELAESEDERIRRTLVQTLQLAKRNDGKLVISNTLADKYIAWLEKRKEQEVEIGSEIVAPVGQAICIDPELINPEPKPIQKEQNPISFNVPYNPDDYEVIMQGNATGIKQKENPKSSDSIPSDCTSLAKCEDRWHKVKDSLPNSTREVLCKDAIGNFFIGRYCKSTQSWEVVMYDDCDKSNEYNPPVVKWCEIPSEKQKEQKPVECIEDSVKFEEGFKAGRESGLRDGQKYVLNNLDSYGLCKPAEWSDTDMKEEK